MFRLVAFHEVATAADADTSVTLANVTGLADQHVTVTGDNIQVPPETRNLMMVYAQGGSLTAGEAAILDQARLEAPSLKPYLDIAALTGLAATADDQVPLSPTPINSYLGKGINFVGGENMQFKTAESVAADDRAATGLIWLGDGNYNIGNLMANGMKTLRATAAITCTALGNGWEAGAITFEQSLEAGMYAVVGMKVLAATPIAGRLIFPNQGARPGCIGYATPASNVGAIENPIFRNGNLGVWGTFSHTAPPQLEVMAAAADTAQEVYLDVVKVG